MPNGTIDAEDDDPTNTGSSSTAPLQAGPDDGEGAGKTSPRNGEGRKDPEDLNLTPQGLSDEPAKREDPDSLAKPDNS